MALNVTMEAAGTLPGYVTSTDYGTLFFDLNKQLIANFDKNGNGFACHPNGATALTLNALGGAICDTDRRIVEEWTWRKPPFGPKAPLRMRLTPVLTMTFAGRHENEIVCSNGMRLECGASSVRRSYIDRSTRDVQGRLKLALSGKNAQTLIQRQRASAKPGADSRLAIVQQQNWTLPALTAPEALKIAAGFKHTGSGLSVTTENYEWIASVHRAVDIKPGASLWRTGSILAPAPLEADSARQTFGGASTW